MKKKTKPPERVRCRDCAKASALTGNGCLCAANGRRVCACHRYGRMCDSYEPRRR